MTKFLVAGDTHGDRGLADRLSYVAKNNDCDAVIQAGDFGFGWGADNSGRDMWLTEVDMAAHRYNIPWMFIDGNHDNHPVLWRTEMPSKMVTYMPRGSTVEFDGVTIGFVGGGVSVDKKWRKVGKSWWATEEISDDELAEIIAKFTDVVDIVISHDSPVTFPALKHGLSDDEVRSYWPADALADSQAHRIKMQKIKDAAKPSLWIHGHYHHRYTAEVDGTHVEGLGNPDQQGVRDGSIILVTEDYNWSLLNW